MAIVLDETTRAEYLAQSLASSRASGIVSALGSTVYCEVYDGANVLRASGTMTVPWATSSGSTITVGEVNASGIYVTSGGVPDGLWYCQFRGSNGRFVRGVFGVAGAGGELQWSRPSFQTGSRGTLGTVTFTTDGAADPTSSRIYSTDMTYVGSFRLPDPSGGTFGLAGFGGTQSGMAFNAAGNGGAGSLFVMGGTDGAYGKRVAEVSIPTPGTGSLASLPTATTLQNFADPAEGQWSEIESSGVDNVKIRGLYVHNGRLIVSAYNFYDASDVSVASHFSRPLNLSTTGDVRGAVRIIATPSVNVRYPVGGMAAVPAAVQSAYGLGPVVAGGAGGSNLSNLSAGPTAFAFDPDEITNSVSSVSSTALVYYPASVDPSTGEARHLQALFGYDLGVPMPTVNATNDWWGSTSFASLAAWCATRPVVLFVGRHGYGPSWYGDTDASGNPIASTGGTPAPDPTYPNSHGNHSYPYAMQVWAYDQSELIAVAQGSKQPWKAQPYARWTLSTPYTVTNTTGTTSGVAHDPATRRIFVAEYDTDSTKPLIHVYTYPAS